MGEPVYKILLTAEWQSFVEAGNFDGSQLDHSDGYIHLSTAAQVSETLRLHFKDKGPLILAKFDGADLEPALKYEPSRGGQLFPHYYGRLILGQVTNYWRLPESAGGTYELPDDVIAVKKRS